MSELPECCAGEGYPGIAHDLLTARTERDQAHAALREIFEGARVDAPFAAQSVVRWVVERARLALGEESV